ncbi:MAG: hypothetical protein WCX48_09715 [Bacteroidales bacterium]
MAPVNKIVKYNLEDKVRTLNEKGTSLRGIADSISKESNQNINKVSVVNFLKSDVKSKAEIIEKKTTLKIKVVEAEISTLETRQIIISKLMDVAEHAEYDRDKTAAYKVATEALDSLDKRLGQVSPDNHTVINIAQNNLTIKDKIQRYRDMGLFNGTN